jgi:hypothetical protein
MQVKGTQLLRWTRQTDDGQQSMLIAERELTDSSSKERRMDMLIAERELTDSAQQKECKMYTILVDALCMDCHSEQLLNRAAVTEGVVESIIGLILFDFLGEIAMGEVRVIFEPATDDHPSIYRLRVPATGLNEMIETPIDLLQARLEHAISCELLEHFHTVVINAVDVEKT